MARSATSGSNGKDFFSQVEDEFEKYYLNDFSDESHFEGLINSTSTNFHKLERIGQNYPVEASGGTSDDHIKMDSSPQDDHVVQSSPQLNPYNKSFEQSSEVHCWDSTKPNSTDYNINNINNNDTNNYNYNYDYLYNRLRATELLLSVSVQSEENKSKISELAFEAMEELRRMAMEGEPLWRVDVDKNIETLNDIEYMREFGNMKATLNEIIKMVEVEGSSIDEIDQELSKKLIKSNNYHNQAIDHHDYNNHLHSEASRESGFIGMNTIDLVEWLMDLKQWSLVFSNIVSRAMILGVLTSTGMEGNYERTLQVMKAEFHVPTPLVRSRESYFARYCKQLGDGLWGVVDVSLESLFQFSSSKFRRRPSGCLIQQMPNGCSKVIWVEHVEVDNRLVHNIFERLVRSGFAFSAKRWVSTIARQCERSAALMATTPPCIVDGVLIPEAGRRSLLKLSERMMRSFWINISGCTTNQWFSFPIPGAEDMRFMITNNCMNNPGMPPGLAVLFATSLTLPTPPNQVFDFLRDEKSRVKWDILSYGHSIKELAYVNNGEDRGNRVSLIQVKVAPDKIAILYLQESYRDSTGSYVVFAPIDILAASKVSSGGNPDYVVILPSGFAVLPDMSTMCNGGKASRSILTMAFHIIDTETTKEYIPSESLNIMKSIITETVTSIKDALTSNQSP